MDTIKQLEIILGRMQSCPKNVARTELEMLCKVVEHDLHLMTVLNTILDSNKQLDIAVKAADIVASPGNSMWSDLGFANSAPVRAALGFEICRRLLLRENQAIKFGNLIQQLGEHYWKYLTDKSTANLAPADSIRVFSQVFLHPLLSYLSGALETREQILLLLSRYKQRSEWFPDQTIEGHANDSEARTEKYLKSDFFKYLFDNDLDFSVEAETPTGGGEADVLVTIPDVGPLALEAKVFDGVSKNKGYVSRGLAQAADYARKFNQPAAYLIVYNISPDTIVVPPGTSVLGNVTRCGVQGVDVYSIAINVNRTIISSRASDLKTVLISSPQSSE